MLSDAVDQLRAAGEVEAEEMVIRNLSDELGRPEPHLDLFDRFADALPGAPASVGPGAGRRGPGPDLRRPGGRGTGGHTGRPGRLRDPGVGHRLDQGRRPAPSVWNGRTGTEFWDVHAALEADHGDWAIEALLTLGADPAPVEQWARRGADAWWAFLDEREAEAPAPAGC